MCIQVTKRKGYLEPLDIQKITNSLEFASKGLNVSISEVQVRANLHFYDGMPTSDIHDIMIRTCKDLFDLKNIDYDKMGANLLIEKIYKEAYNSAVPVKFLDHLKNMINKGKYRKELIDDFSEEELYILEKAIDLDKDYTFTLSGLEQFIDKYMLKENGKIIESPQYVFMAIAMDMFRDYPNKLKWILATYELLSNFDISLPSPEMYFLRTPNTDYASCITIKIGDNIDSWTEGKSAVIKHTTASAGIGVDISSVASVGDLVKNGRVVHSGKVRLMKAIDADIQTSSQEGRRGQAVTYVNFFDPEIVQILGLKSPRTAVDKRINDLKHAIKMNDLVYRRAKENKNITLFSSRKYPKLYELFHSDDIDGFIKEYERLEATEENLQTIHAREFWDMFGTERFENGIYYIMNIDEANINKTYKETIYQSNICLEFISPTKDIQSNRKDEPDVGVCILGNINQGTVGINRLPFVTEVLVRGQNNIMKRQKHPTQQANAFVKEYASIGIGFANHAYFLAKNGVKYGSKEALELHDRWMEHFQFNLIKASVEVAKDFGKAPRFNLTTYADGVMPIDRYKKTVDELVVREYECDWDWLKTYVKKYGMANCAVSMIPPSETSSVIGNMTSGIEPIKDLITIKGSKTSVLKQLAPEALKLADKYDYAFFRKNMTEDFIKHLAVTQKWICMGISGNTFYNPELYDDEKVPLKQIINDIYLAKYYGCKTIYYSNTKTPDNNIEVGCSGGGCNV